MKDYSKFYTRLTAPIRRSPRRLRLLRLGNSAITRLMYALYPLLLLFLLWDNSRAVLPFIMIPGLAFILLSVFRKVYNQPRPYETWEIEPLIIKDSSGKSFPSRHVFSATMISMCFLAVNVWLGLALLILSALLALCRVLGGVHYPKDVIVGYLFGVVCGLFLVA